LPGLNRIIAATPHQLMAIFGWTTLEQAELYTRAADQRRIAEASVHMILPSQDENETFPLSSISEDSGTDTEKN
jgi:hypothetical protein